jgi:1,4-dihydroxy-2-naphthoate octaprenyltransferase
MDLLLATRPWSFSASLSGAVVAASVALGYVALDSLGAALQRALPAVGGIVLAQAGANLVNTYADFQRGVDRKEDANCDDRTLVDGKLSPCTVLLLASAVSCCAAWAVWLTVSSWELGGLLVPLGAWGLLLGLLYSARPISLKYLGLGDATVLAAFGPLLMCGVALVTLGEKTVLGACPRDMVDSRLPAFPTLAPEEGGSSSGSMGALLAYARALGGTALGPSQLWASLRCTFTLLPSLPYFTLAVGLTVVQILHANNVRDIVQDARARVCTLAGLLGFGGSRWYFWVVWVLAFAAGGAGLAVHLVTISSPEVISGGEVLEVLARGADKAALAAFECASAAYGVGSEAWGGAAGGGGGSNFTLACTLPYLTPLEDSATDAEYLDRTSRSLFIRACVMGLLLVLNLAPIAGELCRRMGERELRTLPQASAQFSLLFALTLVACGDFIRGPSAPAAAEGEDSLLYAKVSMVVRIVVSVACLISIQPAFAAAQGDAAFHRAEVVAVRAGAGGGAAVGKGGEDGEEEEEGEEGEEELDAEGKRGVKPRGRSKTPRTRKPALPSTLETAAAAASTSTASLPSAPTSDANPTLASASSAPLGSTRDPMH